MAGRFSSPSWTGRNLSYKMHSVEGRITAMSGPIVRSGPSSKYTENWDSAFGEKKAKPKKKAAAKPAKKKTAKKKK